MANTPYTPKEHSRMDDNMPSGDPTKTPNARPTDMPSGEPSDMPKEKSKHTDGSTAW